MSIVANTDTGEINEVLSIKVGLGVLAKKFDSSDMVKVDPNLLRTANMKENMSLLFGPVTIKITEVLNQRALATVLVQNAVVNVRGVVTINLTEEFISIDHVKAEGTARGVPVSAELVRV